jgi:DNA/RNA endonuclease YhcR with UshA esterase domain
MRATVHVMVMISLLCSAGFVLGQDEAEEEKQGPPLIQVSDADGIAAEMGNEVIIEGTVERAEWSRSGKVMNIDFKDAADPKLLVVVFERVREKFDEAFGGDLSEAITGKKVRVKGKLNTYGGQVEAFKDRPQIIMNAPSQLTILEDEPQEEADAGKSE